MSIEKDYTKKPWIRMTLEDLATPKPGRICKGPAWWAVHDGCVLFFKSYASPQCNAHKAIIERIRPDCTPTFIETSFVPHRCEDYV